MMVMDEQIYGIEYLWKASSPARLLSCRTLWFGYQVLEEYRDRDDFHRLDSVKA